MRKNLFLVFLYMAFVFVVSVLPTPEGVDPFTGFDKVVHFAIYGLMAILWARVFAGGRGIVGNGFSGRVFVIVLALAFFYGLFIELVQELTPSREASFYDALANGLGGAAGAGLYFLVHRFSKKKERL